MKTLYAVTVTLYVQADSDIEAYDTVEGEIDYHIHSETSDSVIQDYSIVKVSEIVQD